MAQQEGGGWHGRFLIAVAIACMSGIPSTPDTPRAMTSAKRTPSREDLTADMETFVEDRFWYGLHTVVEIDALIDKEADTDGGFDLARVKAFAATMLAEKRAAEAQWPQVTDCDKIDRVFDRLLEQRICALQYVGDTLDDGFGSVSDAINADGVPEDRYMGYCFYHSQDIDHALQGNGLMLAFGYLDSDAPQDAVPVGQMICEALRQEGLKVKWDGTHKRRIELPGLRWQRRTPGGAVPAARAPTRLTRRFISSVGLP